MFWWVSAVLILLTALVLDLGLLAYAMYSLLGILIVCRYLTSHWSGSFSANRECNRLTAEVGDTVAVIVDVKNQGNWLVPWVLYEDLLPPDALIHHPPRLQVDGQRLQVGSFWPRATRSLRYQLRCNRRGYYQLGPLMLETGDVFGLNRHYDVASQPHFLLVYPEVIPLEGYEVTSRRPIGEVRLAHRLYEDPTRIAGVRRYEPGDAMNRVNWRATARTGQLHSKVYEPSSVAGATLILDFHERSHDRRHEPHRSELAITATASIANALYELGQQVGLVTNGRDAADRIRQEGWDGQLVSRADAQAAGRMLDHSDRLRPIIVETRRGADQLRRILETLARLELTDGLTLEQLTIETASRLPRDATVLVVLAAVTPEIAIALGNLRRRGFAVTALLNIYEEYDFATASGPLLAAGIATIHLKDRDRIPTVCRGFSGGR